MIKEILLLITGGAITFGFTLLLGRISKRKAKMVWIALPVVHFPKDGLAALQIIIANEGDAPATNVRTIVTLSNKAHFDSVDVYPSEAALEYTCPSKDPLEILLPRVPSQASVSLSCILHSSDKPIPQISIVGDDDTIGAEQEKPSREFLNKIMKRIRMLYLSFIIFLLIAALLMVMWMTVISISFRNDQQQIAIGDLYFKNGEYEAARLTYSNITTEWYEPPKAILYVKSAAVAAAQGRNEAAFELLDQVPKDSWDYVQMLLSDPAFDTLRNQPKFKKLVSRLGQ